MLILQKGQQNELVLNINNNSRKDFSGYTLTFVHILSQEEKTYLIDTSNNSEYGENDRYCEIVLNLQNPGQDLNYEGQYQLEIFGNGIDKVFTSMVRLIGTTEKGNDYISYASPDEDNSNYIYIQD
jgi:hypothetical protein